MVVIVIMVILASVSIGVYNGYVERAKNAVAYEKGHRIAEALKICEAEYGLSGNPEGASHFRLLSPERKSALR